MIGTRGEIIDQWFRSPGRAVLAAGAADWVFERQPDRRFAATFPLALNHLIECLEQQADSRTSTVQQARSAFRVAMAAYPVGEGRTSGRLLSCC